MTVDKLTNESCIAVLEKVGDRYIGNLGYDVKTASGMVRAFVHSQAAKTPDWIDHPNSADTFGPVARQALTDMLASDDERLRKLANTAIAEQSAAQAQVIDLAVLALGGGILLSLAIISKIKRTNDGGWEIEPGFPGLADVLDKAGKLLEKLG